MKNNLKRMLSLLLVLVMMLSAVPFASAEEQTQNAKTFTLNATSATLSVGGTHTISVESFLSENDDDLTATENYSISYRSSNEAVATVANGVVTAVAPGTASITVRASGKNAGWTYTHVGTATVNIIVSSNMTASASAETVACGGTAITLTATYNGSPVEASWSKSGTGDGVLTGNSFTGTKAGPVTLTATYTPDGGTAQTASCSVTVTANTLVATVTPTTLAVGAEAALTATINSVSVSDRTTWSVKSGSTGAGTISGDTFTATRSGNVTLVATCSDPSLSSDAKSVEVPVTITGATVTVTASANEMFYDDATLPTLTAVVKDAAGETVSNPTLRWTSSNAAVLAVNANTGVLSIGGTRPSSNTTVNITAEYTDAEGNKYTSAPCAIVVKPSEYYIDIKDVSHAGPGTVQLAPVLRKVSDRTAVTTGVTWRYTTGTTVITDGKLTSTTSKVYTVVVEATYGGKTISTSVRVSFYNNNVDVSVSMLDGYSSFLFGDVTAISGTQSLQRKIASSMNAEAAAYVVFDKISDTDGKLTLPGTLAVLGSKAVPVNGTQLGDVRFTILDQTATKWVTAFTIREDQSDSTSLTYASGTITINLGEAKGDIIYKTSSGKDVSFNSSDFTAHWNKAVRNKEVSGNMSYVVFSVGRTTPAYGELFTTSGKTTNVAASHMFAATAVGTLKDLDHIVYQPSKSLSAAYEEFIPFTIHGSNSQSVTGVLVIEVGQKNPFTDVKEGDYFYDAVMWAVDEGITTGQTETTFAPNAACTRGQVVTFLWRAAGKPEPTTTINKFTDVKRTDYYYKAVLWAVEEGITTGMTATTFAPNSACTRAQVVTFLHRAAGTPSTTGINTFSDVAASAYYYNAVRWAVRNDITNGMTATTFGSNNSCTRGQIVTFLYRYYAE